MEEDTCVCVEEDTCVHVEEDTCVYVEEDTFHDHLRLTPEEGGVPKAQISDLAHLNRADQVGHAMSNSGVDGVLGNVPEDTCHMRRRIHVYGGVDGVLSNVPIAESQRPSTSTGI